MADPEAASSSGEQTDIQENEKAEEFIEPEKKRQKFCKITDVKSDKLEQRLGGILCCAVCLDLPRAAVYQVRSFSQLIETVTMIDRRDLTINTHLLNLLPAKIYYWLSVRIL